MARDIAIGTSDFEKLIQKNGLYIDKTMYIKDVLDNKNEVVLITRPRRFGKTLNMSMLNCFFDISKDSKKLFEGLNIMKEEKYYTEKLNSTPTIYLSFNGIETDTLEKTLEKLQLIFMDLYQQYSFLLDTDILYVGEIKMFNDILEGKANEVVLSNSIKKLSEYLSRYYKKKIYILIDEYDVPLQKAYTYGFYDKILSFFKSLYTTVFKDNDYLEKAIITGVSRIAKESIFTGANNFKVYSVLNDEFSDDFGITQEEIDLLLVEYDITSKRDEIKHWYNGYKIGGESSIYNPWSILNFLQTKELIPYWVNTSSNDIIKIILKNSVAIKEKLEQLLLDKDILVEINEETILENIENSEDNLWGLLVGTGYLKVVKKIDLNIYLVALPNEEIRYLFKQIINEWFKNKVSGQTLATILRLMLDLKFDEFTIKFKLLVKNMFSYMDVGNNQSENFYHAFLLGILSNLMDTYYITSNKESGHGRYDIMLEPQSKEDTAFILELKQYNPNMHTSINDVLNTAMEQIETKEYESILIQKGYTNICKVVFVFNKKDVEIMFK